MLDRERADFFRTLESLKAAFGPHVVATEIPIGSEHEVRGVDRPRRHEGLRVRRRRRATTAARSRSPTSCARQRRGVPREADGRGRRGLRRADGALPRGRGDLPRGDRHRAQGRHRTTAASSRSSAASPRATSAPTGCSTRSSRTCPRRSSTAASSCREITLEPDRRQAELFAYVFKTRADPFAGRINLFRVYQGVDAPRHARCSTRAPTPRSASASCSCPSGKEAGPRRRASAPATSAPSPSSRRRAPATGWPTRDEPISMPAIKLPGAGDGLRDRAEGQGRRGQGLHRRCAACRRRTRRSTCTATPQTGEQIVAGLSQIHVEVIVDRLKSRFGAEVDAQAAARALPGDDPRRRQGARAPQEADRRPRPVRRLPHRDRAAAPTATTSSSSTRSRAA